MSPEGLIQLMTFDSAKEYIERNADSIVFTPERFAALETGDTVYLSKEEHCKVDAYIYDPFGKFLEMYREPVALSNGTYIIEKIPAGSIKYKNGKRNAVSSSVSLTILRKDVKSKSHGTAANRFIYGWPDFCE